jgi:type II secretory pathway pseudopilin PulG
VLIVIIVIALAFVAWFTLSSMKSKANKDTRLASELQEMRAVITMYKTLNKANPPNLEGLAKQNYSFTPGDAPKPYLPNIKPDASGKLLDPFGNPYKYDAAKGWVVSTTEGYVNR